MPPGVISFSPSACQSHRPRVVDTISRRRAPILFTIIPCSITLDTPAEMTAVQPRIPRSFAVRFHFTSAVVTRETHRGIHIYAALIPRQSPRHADAFVLIIAFRENDSLRP